MKSIESLWDEILSRDPMRIMKIFEEISHKDQKAVVDHLFIMTTEDGWHTAQRQSAQIALQIIKKIRK